MNRIKAVFSTLLAACVLVLFSSAAHATTLTFDSLPTGDLAGNGIIDLADGYIYGPFPGPLFVGQNPSGNPGQDIEGNEKYNNPLFENAFFVQRLSALYFTFGGLDFSALGPIGESETITVEGRLNGVVQGIETYTLATSPAFPYSNWTSEAAHNLAGIPINFLIITLPADAAESEHANIDNVVLNESNLGPAFVPEPSSLALLGTGVVGLLGALKRRLAI